MNILFSVIKRARLAAGTSAGLDTSCPNEGQLQLKWTWIDYKWYYIVFDEQILSQREVMVNSINSINTVEPYVTLDVRPNGVIIVTYYCQLK